MEAIVILGTGLAGYNLAKEYRKLQPEHPLSLITRDDGALYSKPMLSNGFAKQKSADELIQSSAATMAQQLKADIRTYTRVDSVDSERNTIAIGSEQLQYQKLILAIGAAPIIPRFIPQDSKRVFSVNNRLDYAKFRAKIAHNNHIAIIGAGLIGCEFANDLISAGFTVSVIALSSSLMPELLPEPVAKAVYDSLAALGVKFYLQNSVTHIDESEHGIQLQLDSGEKITAQIGLSAIGIRPQVQLAQSAGLKINRGIMTNNLLETSAQDIYALGDCAEVCGHLLPYIMPLMLCSRTLARTISGQETVVQYAAMPVTVKTPACPLVIAPPPAEENGFWNFDQDGPNIKALFNNSAGELRGFALSGSCIGERFQLTKLLPPIHE